MAYFQCFVGISEKVLLDAGVELAAVQQYRTR